RRLRPNAASTASAATARPGQIRRTACHGRADGVADPAAARRLPPAPARLAPLAPGRALLVPGLAPLAPGLAPLAPRLARPGRAACRAGASPVTVSREVEDPADAPGPVVSTLTTPSV